MRIMTISDCPNINTGLARVHRKVIDEFLALGHVVLPCGWFAYDSATLDRIKKGGEKPPPLFYDSKGTQVQMLCVPKGGGMNCMYSTWDVAEIFKPDVIFTIGDFWDFFYMRAVKNKADYSFKWVSYLTIEQDKINKNKWGEVFGCADAIVSPTKFGVEVLKREVGADAEFVPYGVDDVFKKPRDRAGVRKDRGCEGKTRLVTVAQNTIRKNLPALALAARALDKHDPHGEIQFYVHTGTRAVDKQDPCVYDMEEIVEQLGVADRFVFPDQVSVFKAAPDEFVADEYAAADWFVLPSTAEGYGMPLVEAMACGVPAIAHSATAVTEHLGAAHGVGPRGIAVGGTEAIFAPSRLAKAVNHDELATAIIEAWKQGRPEGMSERCREYAGQRTWGAMGNALGAILEGVAGPARVAVEVL